MKKIAAFLFSVLFAASLFIPCGNGLYASEGTMEESSMSQEEEAADVGGEMESDDEQGEEKNPDQDDEEKEMPDDRDRG